MAQTGMSRDELLKDACDPKRTPFDYLVIGSGAGGGTVAARLARAGKRVLLIEAGCDPALKDAECGDPVIPEAFEEWHWRKVYRVPGYHAAATEDPQTSWEFSVRHYQDDNLQSGDKKYSEKHDPSRNGGQGKGGVQYPRCSALGGCTTHYAMLMFRPNDSDWDGIAKMTGDDSWRADRMQGYFARIEDCLYKDVYQGFLRKALWVVSELWLRLLKFLKPRSQLERGGHGFSGWQKTSFVNPSLVLSIARSDPIFRKLLHKVLRSVLTDPRQGRILRRALLWLQIVQALDPNDLNRRRRNPAGLKLVPIGTDGSSRTGLREWLLQTAKDCPDRLVIETGAFVERILFARDTPPRACGVRVYHGRHLYEVSPKPGRFVKRQRYFAKHEVIVCGGAFNTPQLLMLSGIGDPAHLRAMGITELLSTDGMLQAGKLVELPGVGRNLQDRYEISVVSELEGELPCLQDASFAPGDRKDPLAQDWRRTGGGLYATNGAALALLLNSNPNSTAAEAHADPDLVILGFPAAFRGYYWGWSKDLLKADKEASRQQRNLWSWVILKAYTSNSDGVVRLRTRRAFDQPEINFRYFEEGPDGHEDDMRALTYAIKHVRQLNAPPNSPFQTELQPGKDKSDDSEELKDWIRKEAWGHHACGTCRIGSQPWQADTGKLRTDELAVVDSRFRVHGVKGLRVVDASVFPRIPGYFICAAIFMIAEKAADAILADFAKHPAQPESYPPELESLESEAVKRRRRVAPLPPANEVGLLPEAASEGRLPPDTVGLALSGGGIRSGTFSLGVLQALAEKNKLRCIDILSTVSGGGFAGGFLGRLFTRLPGDIVDKAGRVQQLLADTNSAEMWWLRRHANYILAGGRPEWYLDLGILWRNAVALYLCVAALCLGVFGAMRWIADRFPGQISSAAGTKDVDLILSPWWWLPIAVLLVAIGPGSLAFWLTSRAHRGGGYPLFSLLAWIVLLAGAAIAFAMPTLATWGAVAVGMLLLAWFWQEVARWGLSPDDGRASLTKSIVVRNRVTRYLGIALFTLLLASLWVLLDTLARYAAAPGYFVQTAVAIALLSIGLPVLGLLTTRLGRSEKSVQPFEQNSRFLAFVIAPLAYALLGFLLFAIDAVAHQAFDVGMQIGTFLTVLALTFSLAIGQAFDILNRSSLQSAYAERVARTFLGATNDSRTHPTETDSSPDVQLANPNDDLAFDEYHPERVGGPLHLINVCINETADAASGRRLPGDRGLPMCVGPQGVSVGLRHHAVWETSEDAPAGIGKKLVSWFEGSVDSTGSRKLALRALPIGSDPDAFHVLGRRDRKSAAVESLRLSQWMGISAAALTTGLGRGTRMPLSLMLGLLNLRLGYWWDSGINAGDRPDRFPPGFWRRVRSFYSWLFGVQSKILAEWRGYFLGPSDRHWYLTDGGHFENLGLYELIRRKIPFIIAVDATEDHRYEFADLALLTRQARLDFGAEFEWVDPASARNAGETGWCAIDVAASVAVPALVRGWLNPDALGGLSQITRNGPHSAALARIRYKDGCGDGSWLLLVKTSIASTAPLDVRVYASQNESFPNQSTLDQFFDDDQWESYRSSGQTIGRRIFR